MLKKSITYTDFNGDEVTEDFFFHLSKADLVEMEVAHKGGLSKHLQDVVASEDGATIINEFKNLIVASYGVKSDDGRRFIKSKMVTDEFLQTEAYSTLFLELCTNATAAAEFVNGMLPQGLADDVAKISAETIEPAREHPSDPAATPMEPAVTGRNVFEQTDPVPVPSIPFESEEPRLLTKAEIVEMDDAELRTGLAEGRYKLA